MSHFPKLLSSQIAFDVARTMLDGFDKHYRLFREVSVQAKLLEMEGDQMGPFLHEDAMLVDHFCRHVQHVFGLVQL